MKVIPVHKALDKVISKKAPVRTIAKFQGSYRIQEIRIHMQPSLTILVKKHHVLMSLTTTVQKEGLVKAHTLMLAWRVLAWDLLTRIINQVGPN